MSPYQIINDSSFLKKVGKKDQIGFEVGDSVNIETLDSLLYDEKRYLRLEGTEVSIKLKRNGN